MSDKIPIGHVSHIGPDYYQIIIKTKHFKEKHKAGDIITLDMIEPYESEAVRKVTEYLEGKCFEDDSYESSFIDDHAKAIVALVHEAEDADE